MEIGDQGDNMIAEVHLMGVAFVCMCHHEMLPDILDVVVWKGTG